jgi:hypothetical protein
MSAPNQKEAAPMIRAAGLIGFAVLAATLAVPPAWADDAAVEATYGGYHRAIRAAELCEDRAFDQDAHAKMAGVIDEKIHYAIGAGRRLVLIDEAKSEMGKVVEAKGCGDTSVQEALALFHGDLEPALQ